MSEINGRVGVHSSVIVLAMLLVLASAIPGLATSSALGHASIGDCSADGWHGYTQSLNDKFTFGTGEQTGEDCYQVKVQARYWTDAPPYGWITTSVYSSSSSVVRTVYDAPAHDWSRHTVCDPNASTCTVFDLA